MKDLRALLCKYHFVIPLSVLVLINSFLARGWLSDGLPKGHDTMAALPIWWPLREYLFNNSTAISWNTSWFLGHPTVWRLPEFLGIFIASDMGIKIFHMAIFVFAGIFAYFFVYEITKNSSASFFSAIFYTFLPYHFVESIFEGHIGLSMTYTLTPLVFLLLEKNSKSISLRLTILAGFTVAIFLLSAPQAFPLVGPFILAYCLFKIFVRRPFRKAREFVKTVAIVFTPLMIGLLLSAYWWLPLIFERSLFSKMRFPIEETIQFTPPFLDLITFRPSSCCSPNTAFVASSLPISIIQLFIPLLALSAPILLSKNRYVIFFSITGLIAIIFAMGVYSPIPLFTFAFKYIPFFDGIRTPGRFLIFAAFAFSVLAGFTIVSISSRIRFSIRIRRPYKISLVLFILSLLVIGSVYRESQEAFQTFDLEPSQKEAMAWLSGQEGGRLISLPWLTYSYTPEKRFIVFPWNYVHLHEKEVLSGGAHFLSLQNTVNLLKKLIDKVYTRRITSIDLVDMLGIKYVVLDGNYPNYLKEGLYETAYADLESSWNFEKVWSQDNVAIFKNLYAFPRIFLQRENEYIFEDYSFELIHPGKYKVNVKINEPSYLILTESYHHNWVAKDLATGTVIVKSEPLYTALNGFWLETGEYTLILEYEESPPKKIGTTVSILTLIACLGYLIHSLPKIRIKYKRKRS